MFRSLRKLRYALLRPLTPLQRIFQGIGKPEPKITSNFVSRAILELQDGDILLSRENWRFTSLLIGGFWTHAAIYCKGNVIEAVGKGVRYENVYRWLYQKDHVAVMRAHFLERDQRCNIGAMAAEQVGRSYDFLFRKGKKSFYCSELCVWAYNAAVVSMKNHIVYEVESPQDIYEEYRFKTIIREINI